MFKSQLQEYAQKAGLPAPVYDIKKEGPAHEPQFKASVTLQGEIYESPTFLRNLKKAEHAAAEVALAALGAASSGPLHESGLCKNLLQEYAQKCKLPLPIYRVTKTGETHMPSFIATVEIAGVLYNGGNCKTKKEAEIKAARTALVAIYADSGAPSLEAVEGHAPFAHDNTASAPAEPTPAEPSSGAKRKRKLVGGNIGRKQKVQDEPDMMDEDWNGDVLQAIADTETVIEKVDDPKQENGSSTQFAAGNRDALQAVADTETANQMVDDSKQVNGSSSLPTDSVDKGPEQNLLGSAAAENPKVSPCANGTELSVQSPPHAQEQ